MAGFDLDSQRPFTIPAGGLRGEVGYFDFTAAAATKDVPTTLTKAWFGLSISKTGEGAGDNETLIGTTDCDISNSALTWTRGNPAQTIETVRMYYILLGW